MSSPPESPDESADESPDESLDGHVNDIKAPPLGPLLYRQYKEQSTLCDATIKMGLWEKRFHWCVLVASPFFNNIYESNFLEKQTGVVELNKWPASELEMALLFLYGRTPEVTDENSGILLDIAEFLLIPELKTTCIKYLEGTKVTLDNCMQLYELSSVYRFTLKSCDDFIKGKLPEVLKLEPMLNITREALKVFLSDPTLSYVTVQTWFPFLVRWVQKEPERQDMFVELLSMLDFSDCNKDFVDNTIAKEPLVMNADEEVMERLMSVGNDQNDTFIIFCDHDHRPNDFWCLNMRTMVWYQSHVYINLKCRIVEDYYHFNYTRVAGVKSSSSSCMILKIARKTKSLRVFTYDLNKEQYSVAVAVSSEPKHPAADADGDDDFDLHMYSLKNDILAVISRTQIPVYKVGDGNRKRSTLYILTLDEPVPKLHPVLTLKDHSVVAVVGSNNGTVAMLAIGPIEKLFIYNILTAELDCIHLNHDHGIEICAETGHLEAVEDDFLLHYNDTVVCISKLSETSLESKYLVKQITLQKAYEYRYLFGGDRWFRFQSQGDDVRVDWVSHKTLSTLENTSSLCWEQIPIPPKVHIDCSLERDLSAFPVSLPRGILRCHLNCPHCKMTKNCCGPGIMFLGKLYDSDANDDESDE